jgi:hypothetical protein
VCKFWVNAFSYLINHTHLGCAWASVHYQSADTLLPEGSKGELIRSVL